MSLSLEALVGAEEVPRGKRAFLVSELKHGSFAGGYKRGGYEDVDTFMGCPEGIAEPVSEVA